MDTESCIDRRASRKEDRRQAILDVARASFLEHGFADTSMSAIAASCGGSKTTLWSHFPSKDALFLTFLDTMVDSFADALDEALITGGGGTAGALRRFGRVFLVKILSDDATALRRLITAESHRFPQLAEAFHTRGPARMRGRLARWVADEMLAGRLRRGDPEQAARQFLALCQAGAFADIVWHDADGPKADPEADVEAALDAFLRIWRARG